MKIIIACLFWLLVACSASAADLMLVGLDFTPTEKETLSEFVEIMAPRAKVQLTMLPIDQEYPSIKSVNYLVLHNGTIYHGVGAGFSSFDAAQRALERAYEDIGK